MEIIKHSFGAHALNECFHSFSNAKARKGSKNE